MSDPEDKQEPKAEQPVEQVPAEVVEDLTIAQGIGLPPVPKGMPAPNRLKWHG